MKKKNYTLPVLNIPYLSSSRNIKFPREISSYFTANSPYFAAKKKSISRVFFLLFGEISRGFRREKMHFIIAENKKWVIEFKSTVIWSLEVSTRMMIDFLCTQEDFSAHAMHYVCCHTHYVMM